MLYPATFKSDKSGGFVVTFRDVPEAITQGDDEQEAMEMAVDALVTAIDFYFEDQRKVPLPSAKKRGEKLVELPISLSAKVLLLNEMLNQKVRPSELAKRMSVKPQDVNRILNLEHKTKIDTVVDALHALGKNLDLVLV